jgi:hypothetical protein
LNDNSNIFINRYGYLIPFLILTGWQLPLLGWIVDDAVISMVYARNLIQGYGLLAQPGSEAVEGFTNFLWVLLYSPFFLFQWTEPYVPAKLLSFICMFLFYKHAYVLLKALFSKSYLCIIALSAFSFYSPVIVWTSSGLEGPLLLLLLVLMMKLCFSINENKLKDSNAVLYAVILSLLLFLCRPDAVIFAIVPFSVLLFKKQTTAAIKFALISLAGLGMITAFRYLYFGQFLPNTFYAKIEMDALGLSYLFTDPLKLLIKFAALLYYQSFFLLEILLFLILLITVYKSSAKLHLFFAFLIAALLQYMLISSDWMPHLRFGIAYLFVFNSCLFLLIDKVKDVKRKHALTIAACLLISLNFIPKTLAFYQQPAIPYSYVATQYGKFYNDFLDENNFNAQNKSILLPDMGATLFHAKYQAIDLAGLCHKGIAKKAAKGAEELSDYICHELKPDIIHIHGVFIAYSGLIENPCLMDNYSTLFDANVNWEEDYVYRTADFIRNDLILNDAHLKELQQSFKNLKDKINNTK